MTDKTTDQQQVREDKTRTAFDNSGPVSPDGKLAEKKRRAAVANTGGDSNKDKMIAALLRERSGLEQRDKKERLAEVDKQLEHYGYKPDGSKSDDSGDGDGRQEARKQAPQGRSAKPPTQTGDKTGG